MSVNVCKVEKTTNRLRFQVLKALGLGARAVFVGRPILWGLAYDVRELPLEIKSLCQSPELHIPLNSLIRE